MQLRLLIILIFCFPAYASAGVILTGTRIIFAEGKDKTIQLTNNESQSFIVQVQIDTGASESLSPFIITPPVFKMSPHSGQSVRLTYTGEPLPQDRESVFYLSFSQLPLLKTGTTAQNKLILAITHRVKLFYRPATLSGHPGKTAEQLILSVEGQQVRVTNQSEYHASVRHIILVRGDKEIRFADGVMIPPKSSMLFTPSSAIRDFRGALLRFVLVNDYGADIVTERQL